MANEKGGSDLDVFEGLTKKPASAKPSFPPPGPPPSRAGGPSGPPGPPPSMRERPKTMLGIAPPPVGLPPASALPPSGPPGPPPGPASFNPKNTVPMQRPSTLSSPLPAPAGPPGPPPSLRSAGGLPPVAPAPSRPPVAGPPPAAATKPSSVVDMDWDDEDEKTNIYDKDETQQGLDKLSSAPLPAAGAKPNLGTAAALAAGSGGTPSSLPLPAPLPPPTSARMPTPPPGSLPSAARALTPPPGTLPTSARMPTPPPGSLPIAAQPSRFDGTQAVSKPSGGGKGGLIAALVGGVALLAIGGYMLTPKTGNLIVSIKSRADGRTVDKPQVFVNEKKICDSSPCRVDNLPKGTVVVKASAAGYEGNDSPATIRAGEDTTLTLELFKSRDSVSSNSPSSVDSAPKTTGFKAAGPSHIKVSLDGKELGSLPQDVKDVAPGSHKIRFASSDLYQADERTVTLTEGKVEDLGNVKLKVVKGRATITLDTPGASVKLISGTDRRILPTLPIKVDIDTSKQWTIEATKVGYENLTLPISFDDGEAEKTFAVALLKKGEKPKVDTSSNTSTGTPPATTAKPDDKPAPAVADTGMATLNIMSVPPANCVLDGRPLGQTPKPGVSVSAGTHTILFVHPEKGRKTQTVTVKGGETKPVIVKF